MSDTRVADSTDRVVGRAVLWLLAGAVVGYLTGGLASGKGPIFVVGGGIVGLIAAALDVGIRRRGGVGLRPLGRRLLPSQIFAMAYAAALMIAPWTTRIRDYGFSVRMGLALVGVIVVAAGFASLVVLSSRRLEHVDRGRSQARLTHRIAIGATVVALLAVPLRGIGLLLVPEALAFWFTGHTMQRELDPPESGSALTRVAKAVGATMLLYVVLLVGVFVSDPLGLGGGSPFDILYQGAPSAPSNLLDATPDLRPPMHLLQTATASEMTRRFPRHTFVAADRASNGPDVISVNPIDDYTWSAVARSRSGRCYAVIWITDRVHPQYGGSKYGFIARDKPCAAQFATPQTITGENW